MKGATEAALCRHKRMGSIACLCDHREPPHGAASASHLYNLLWLTAALLISSMKSLDQNRSQDSLFIGLGA